MPRQSSGRSWSRAGITSAIWSAARCSTAAREIGRVEDVQFGAGEAPLLIVGNRNKRYEIPFAEAYLKGVDLAHKQMRMKLPEGMLELNAPLTAEEKQSNRTSEAEEERLGKANASSEAESWSESSAMKIDILTIFPDFFRGPLDHGIIRRAGEMGLATIEVHDLRAFAHDTAPHRG